MNDPFLWAIIILYFLSGCWALYQFQLPHALYSFSAAILTFAVLWLNASKL